MMRKILYVLLTVVGLLLPACGVEPQSDLTFRTELISETEREVPEFYWEGRRSPEAHFAAPGAQAAIVNLLAGVAQKVMTSDQRELPATIIGHAIPKGIDVFDLQGGKEVTKTYRKIAESPVGNNLVEIEYKISYLYGLSHKGKGKYLANVRFTPVRLYTNPLWSVSAMAVSDAATNAGTASNPVAKLHFTVTFGLKGVGSATVTDDFTVDGETGKLIDLIQPLSDEDS